MVALSLLQIVSSLRPAVMTSSKVPRTLTLLSWLLGTLLGMFDIIIPCSLSDQLTSLLSILAQPHIQI
jgi:hypothetical protein